MTNPEHAYMPRNVKVYYDGAHRVTPIEHRNGKNVGVCTCGWHTVGYRSRTGPANDLRAHVVAENTREAERETIAASIEASIPHYEPDQYGVCDAQGALHELARDIRKGEHHAP